MFAGKTFRYSLLSVLVVFSVAVSWVSYRAVAQDVTPNREFSPQAGFADLIEAVSPAVVHVAVSGTVPSRNAQIPDFNFPPGSPFEDFFDQFRIPRDGEEGEEEEEQRPLGIGSGFIISADGYIVTNHHVVQDADEITIRLLEGREYDAELVGSDTKTDLALLKMDVDETLPFVSWGDVDESRVGDWVLAIGNPFGLGGSATIGIISARGRDIQSGPYDDYLQVDAAINRGNSGGPLFDLSGQVIGINTAIFSPNGGSVGIGFAIPSNLAKQVIGQLQEKGRVDRGWLGVQIQSLNEELADGFGRDDESGALVSSVLPDSPAEDAKFRAGDIILEFDGKPIEEMRDLPRVVAEVAAGSTVDVKVWRDGREENLDVRIGEYPDDEELALAEPDSDEALGATLSELTDALRGQYRLGDDTEGVLVVRVERGGLAAENGLRPGDLIQRIGRKAVSTPGEVETAIEEARESGSETVVFLVSRNGSSSFMPFTLD
jgi:serine protease Do